MAQTQKKIRAKESWKQTENQEATREPWQQLLGNVVSVGISFGICGLKRAKNLKRNKRKQGRAEGRGTRLEKQGLLHSLCPHTPTSKHFSEQSSCG